MKYVLYRYCFVKYNGHFDLRVIMESKNQVRKDKMRKFLIDKTVKKHETLRRV